MSQATAVLIGSEALRMHNPRLVSRPQVDQDFICTPDEFEFRKQYHLAHGAELLLNEEDVVGLKKKDSLIVELTKATPGSSSELLLEIVNKDPNTKLMSSFTAVASLGALFAIKTSHRYKKFNNGPEKFYKHFMDWHMLNALGVTVPEMYKEFVKLRSKESYNYAHPKLNVTKDEFFKDDGLTYVYDHDWIHTVVALGDAPAYQSYVIDEVECSKEKFFEQPLDVRLNGVIEEACVLAIERALVPHGIMNEKQSFLYAYAKVATSITSGWFRKFAYDFGPEVLKRYPTGYWDKFQEAVKAGPVYHR